MSAATPRFAGNPRRAIAAAFGEIANTLDWNHHAWLALMVKLEATGKTINELTLADVVAAINEVPKNIGEVRE